MKIIKSVLGPKAERAPVLRLRRRERDRRGVHADGRGDGGPDGRAAGGVTPRVQDRGLTAALFGLLTVEARHAAWARHIVGATPAADRVRRAAWRSTPSAARSPARTSSSQRPRMVGRRSSPPLHGLMRGSPARPLRVRPRSRSVAGSWSSRSAVSARAAAVGATAAPGPRLPRRVAPAFTPGEPARLRRPRYARAWAPVRRPAAARAAPAAGAPGRGPLAHADARGDAQRRRGDRPPARTGRARAWVARAPRGAAQRVHGLGPRTALGGYDTVDTRLDVDLPRLRATLLPRRPPVLTRRRRRRRAAAGRRRAASFYVRNRLTRYRSPAYGPVAFGTSARSARATDWPAGGFVGHPRHRPARPGPRPRVSTAASACATRTSSRWRG